MKEFISSSMVGVTQTLIGLPFDTVKVWIQNNKPVVSKNIFDYYRGSRPEFCSAIISNCIVFPSYKYTLDYTNHNPFLSGGLAGIFNSFFVYPLRTSKIYKQMGMDLSLNQFLKLRGRGYFSTFFRESVGFSMYFGMYSYARNNDVPIFLSGALAGLFNWGVSYPFDTIGNRQIAQNISILNAVKIGNIYRGYGVCLLRSMVVNACNFLVYEKMISML